MIPSSNSTSGKCMPVYPYPILSIETSSSKKYLIISDVHIGWDEGLKKAGLTVDISDYVIEMANTLIDVQQRTSISNLVILGDLKSSVKFISSSEWRNVPLFIRKLEEVFTVYIIPGNHDGNILKLLPNTTNLMLTSGMKIEDILLIHGHTKPRITHDIRRIIAGHLHPTLRKNGSILDGSKVWVKLVMTRNQAKSILVSNERKIELIILPHFNNFLDYQVKSKKSVQVFSNESKLPFLDSMLNAQHWKVSEAYLFSVDGSLVGLYDDVQVLLYGESQE